MRARKRAAGTLVSQMTVEESAEACEQSRTSKINASLHERASLPAALWPDCDTWRPKSMFDVYYRLQKIVERHEWCMRPSTRALQCRVHLCAPSPWAMAHFEA